MALPYDDANGGWLPMSPDFIYFREAGETVVADVIDPHGLHRLSFDRLKMVIYDKDL